MLEAKNTRPRKLSMLFIAFFAIPVVLGAGNSFHDFQTANKDTIDYGSMKMCWMHGATKVATIDGNTDKGYSCAVTLKTHTEDENQAKELCESRIPYYIIGARNDPNNKERTMCTFQINLKCEESYWQIHGKCYKVSDTKFTLPDAEKFCDIPGSQGKLAQYYSRIMQLYLGQMVKIRDAWVTIPDMKDYYDNGKGHKGVYIQEAADEYDVRKGTILMAKEDSLHQAICEYTPPMTRAEMFYLAKIYSEIYPFEVYGEGALIPTANFMTIQQKSLSTTKDQNNRQIPTFTEAHMYPVCMNIGRILNVESYPITALEEEFDDVKHHLTRERYYMTSAYKNDGCYRGDFRQYDEKGKQRQIYTTGGRTTNDYCEAHSLSFSSTDRYPTMAAMRAPLLCALHTFNYEYVDCPPGPDWTEPPIRFEREGNRPFCHYINNKNTYTLDKAISTCEQFKTSLSGFDSADEFDAVLTKLSPQVLVNSAGNSFDRHYWLGGVSPCQTDCDNNGERFVASWNNGVGVNTRFLNTYNHSGFPWVVLKDQTQFVSFRQDNNAFHVHIKEGYPEMLSVCGRTAPLEKKDKKTGGVIGAKPGK